MATYDALSNDPSGPAGSRWRRPEGRALIVGAAGLGVCAVWLLVNPGLVLRSYLVAFNYWLGIGVGSLAIMMTHQLTGGRWGLLLRRFLEAAVQTMPLLAVLFLPVLLGLRVIYVWTRPDRITSPELAAQLQHKALYLNVGGFVLRAVIYFAVWTVLAFVLSRLSRRQQRAGDPRVAGWMRTISGPGLVLYGLTITFAAVDWVMSLQPGWWSTIFGVVYGMSQVLGAFALMVVALDVSLERPAAAGGEPVPPAAPADGQPFRDLGNLMLMLVMFWAYVAFSQFLLIWAGNLPAETQYFLPRLAGGWAVVAVALIGFQFFVPFLMLLLKRVKKNMHTQRRLALWILAMYLLNVFWQIIPAFEPAGLAGHWPDMLLTLIAMAGVGGLWMAAFLWNLHKQPLLPQPVLPTEKPV